MPRQQPAPAPVTPTSTPTTTLAGAYTPPPPRPSARRVSLNVFDGIDAAVSLAAANSTAEAKSLSEEVAFQLFEQFKQKLLADDKSVVYGQFSLAKTKVFPQTNCV